jgi:MFS family permease
VITLLASIGVILGLAATAADHFHTDNAAPVWRILLFAGLLILALAVVFLLLAVLLWPRRDEPRPRHVPSASVAMTSAALEREFADGEDRLQGGHRRLRRRRRLFRLGVALFVFALIWFGAVVTVGVGSGEIKVGGTGGKGGMGGRGGNGGNGGHGANGGNGGNGSTGGQLKVTVHVVDDDEVPYVPGTTMPPTR